MSEGEGAGMMSEGGEEGLSYLSHDACDVPTLSLSTSFAGGKNIYLLTGAEDRARIHVGS